MRLEGSRHLALPLALWVLALGCSDNGSTPAVRVDAGATPEAAAHLEHLRGKVTLERGGKQMAATFGYLYVQDALETGEDSEARVRFPGGRVVELGADARFVIGEDASGLVLKVERGLVLTRVPMEPAPQGAPALRDATVMLSILTPQGLTRVPAAGSELKVSVSDGASRVDVVVGSIEFVSRNGKSVTAEAGDRIDAADGEARLVRGRELVLEPMKVVVLGAGEVKKKGTERWKGIGRQGAELGQGDAVRARRGSLRLDLGAGASKLELKRGGELAFEGSARSERLEESSLELKSGELLARFDGSRTGRLVLGGARLTSEKASSISIARTGAGLEVLPAAGDLTLELEGKVLPVRAGEAVTLGREGVATRPVPLSPAFVPPQSGVRIYHPGVASLALAWEGETRDYLLEVATDAAMKNLVLSGLVHRPGATVTPPARGTLYWRVKEPDGSKVLHQGSATFAPEPNRAELGVLRNEVPEGNEKTTIYFQDKPPAVTFTYAPEPKATRYRILVYREGDLSSAVAERSSKETRAVLQEGVLSEGSYFWSVTPLSEKGEELRGGKMNRLELVYDNAVQNLVIKSPKNGDLVNGERVQVSGIAPLGARVSANGRSLALDEKSRFLAPVSPVGQPPTVVFRMSRPGGPDVVTIRVLRRKG